MKPHAVKDETDAGESPVQKTAFGQSKRDETRRPRHLAIDRFPEIAPELTGQDLPLSKCEAYNRVYDQPHWRLSRRFSADGPGSILSALVVIHFVNKLLNILLDVFRRSVHLTLRIQIPRMLFQQGSQSIPRAMPSTAFC